MTTDYDHAMANIVLLAESGSGLHGCSTPQSDRDYMGICIEPESTVHGLGKFTHARWRNQPDGARSGPDDVDITIYGLRRFCALAGAGNPTVAMLLWAPPGAITARDSDVSYELQQQRAMFTSKQMGARFSGYLDSQRNQLTGDRPRKHTNRPELEALYGYDTKFAFHAIRLGLQGCEVMRTGELTLPIPEPHRERLMAIRRGELDRAQVVSWADRLLVELEEATAGSALPDLPDWDGINDWLASVYRREFP